MKPTLVGLNNPLSPVPRMALAPYPPGCTGARLLEMIQLAEPTFGVEQYLDAFERENLWKGMELPEGPGAMNQLLREGRRIFLRCSRSPQTVVLLGARVWYAVLNRQAPAWFTSQRAREGTFWYLPHPSGMNRLYNDESNRRRAGAILLAIAQGREP